MPPVILWVEHSLTDVTRLETAFCDAAIAVRFVIVRSAVEAFQYMERHAPFTDAPWPPDLILLELDLPALRGDLVLQEIQKSSFYSQIPAVVLSATRDPAQWARCRTLGAAACIAKPTNAEAYGPIVSQLRTYLPRSGGHSTHGDPSPGPTAGDPESTRHYIKS